MEKLDKGTHIRLRQLITEYFSLSDIRTICFDLSIDYESLGGENLTKPERVLALLNYTSKRGQLRELLGELAEHRPHIPWDIYFHEEIFSSPIYYNLPSLPPHFLERNQQLQTLKSNILEDASKKPVAIVGQSRVYGLHGMGGLGKTVLATTLVYDNEIRETFRDGIIWLTLGQEPNILALLVQLGQALGLNFEEDKYLREKDIDEAISRLRTRLQLALFSRNFLIVLDDVWRLEDMLHFQYPNSATQLIVTTRNVEIITGSGAYEYSLGELNETEALELLMKWTGIPIDEMPKISKEVIRECGYLPLALSICGALIHDGISWVDVLESLQETDVSFLEYQDKSVANSIQVSLNTLPDTIVQAFFTFAIFPEDTPVSEKALLVYWQHLFCFSPRECRKILNKLVNRSLVKINDIDYKREYFLHDIIDKFVKNAVGNTKQLHKEIIQAFYNEYPKGKSLPQDEYFLSQMGYHTFESGVKFANSAFSIMFSFIFTLSILFLILPLLVAISILIKLDSPGPTIFKRQVLGVKRNRFDAYKFRTMYINGDEILSNYPELRKKLEKNHKLKADPRITKIGRYLRKYSLDDLSQFINVLKFEMTLVGPRMISPEEIENYGKFGDSLLMVMPGITGAWQVFGSSQTTYDDRILMDIAYIYNRSFLNDLKILLQTIPAVSEGRGAY